MAVRNEKMNLKAYSNEEGLETPLFARQCNNKSDAKKVILYNPWAFRISWILFKSKRYEMKEVYLWK